MFRITSLALAVTILTLPAAAQNLDVIKERKAALKAMGDATKPVSAMVKGEAEFDQAKLLETLKVIQEKTAKLPELFPDDSKTGGETKVLPAIWEKKDDVVARFKKTNDAAKAAETTITADNLETEWKELLGNCGGCHKLYKEKDE